MISSILIANRGEIACRIIRTCHRLGIRTVAVYSEADRYAKHTLMANQAIAIGPSSPLESYLKISKIIAAAKEGKVEAIHPGYGFLSENPDFATTVSENGIKFIGPNPETIRIMGLKDKAKATSEAAGVPVVPGFYREVKDRNHLIEEAKKIGYPILLKAIAGGGGKGIRLIQNENELLDGFEHAINEAKLAFGNPDLMIEKFIQCPRHIEVQVFGDNFDNHLHLFERDCSVQRRNQKVIEEAPAPSLSMDSKEFLYGSAVKLAKSIGYVGAGTIEFIADASKEVTPDNIYFLEMNTRLQVEHTVSEEITGIDFVEWQIKVASNQPLPLKQDQIKIKGHSLEARICSEDVLENYLPSVGKLNRVGFPEGLRVESGIRSRDIIAPFYDSLVAKVISTENSREQAIQSLSNGLRECSIEGVKTNLNLLVGILGNKEFIAGGVNTNFLSNHLPMILPEKIPPEQILLFAGAASVCHQINCKMNWFTGFSHWHEAIQQFTLLRGSSKFYYCVKFTSPNRFWVSIDKATSQCEITNEGLFSDQKNISNHIFSRNNLISVYFDGFWEFKNDHPEENSSNDQSLSNFFVSQVPGLLRLGDFIVGKSIKKGEIIARVEAMKMEFIIEAPRDCIIKEILAEDNSQIGSGDKIVELE